MAILDSINRTYTVSILPDMRKRVVQRFDITDGQATMSDGTKFDAKVKLPWGTENDDYPGCRLTKQDVTGQTQNDNKAPNDPPAFLIRVWDEIHESEETQVGNADITYDQYNNKIVTLHWIQFSTGALDNQTVGVTAAPSPNETAILKEQVETDDGTLRTITRVYTTGGILSDVQNLRFGGKVIVRTITSLNEIPATPAGFTLVGPGVVYVRGLPLYTYEFAAAAGSGGTPGTSGQISIDYSNAQGGAVNFDPANPAASNGVTQATIRYVSPLSVTSNPIPTPAGFVLVGIEQTQDTGYTLWTGHYERAQGLVVDEKTISEIGALVVYHRVQYATAPTTPTATIGGTVTLFDTSVSQGDGWVRYDYKWAEGDGQSDYTVEGQRDGALIYTVVAYTLAASVPAYPGTGTAYNTRLQQKTGSAYFTNIAVWHKPPATVTLKQTTQFEKPGSAVFTGSPPQLVITAPVTVTILADMEVSYGTSQITDVPFTVSQPATFYEAYTPTDTGIAVTSTQALGRYLAGASGISGTNSVYNGILCDTWSATLGSSTPSSFSLDVKVLKTDNEIYLTDVSGVVVFRRTKISYDFS